MIEITKKALEYVHKPKKFHCIPMLTKADMARTLPRIRQAFLDVSMNCQHRGLTKVAKRGGVNVHDLKPGEFVLFVNARFDKMKLFATQNIIIYIAAPKGRKVSQKFLEELPKIFDTNATLNYDEALQPVLKKYLEPRSRKVKELKVERH